LISLINHGSILASKTEPITENKASKTGCGREGTVIMDNHPGARVEGYAPKRKTPKEIERPDA